MIDEIIVEEAQQTAEEHVSELDALAAEYGWHKDGEKSSEEYIKLAMEEFPKKSKKLNQMFQTIEELKAHMSKTEQVAYERAKRDLENDRLQAIREGDVVKVQELEAKRAEFQEPALVQKHPAIIEFEERNASWLNDTSLKALKMHNWMEEYAAELGKRRLPPEHHMKMLEEAVKKEFSDYFNPPEKKPSSKVESNSDSAPGSYKQGKKTFTFKDLSPEQKKMASNFNRLGVMTIDNYIKDLVDNGELK